MYEYEIKSLETGALLGTVIADGFVVSEESGIVTFFKMDDTKKRNTAVTQASTSFTIAEKLTGKPALVAGIPKMYRKLEAQEGFHTHPDEYVVL